jgi:flagellar basal-body rod protein FlgC
MDYSQSFSISAAGMALERTRVDVASLNLANANTVQTPDGAGYRPMRVVARAAGASVQFAELVDGTGTNLAGAGTLVTLEPADTTSRQVYEPGHPYADQSGFVHYAGVDTPAEMVTLMTAIRSYEANVAAMNATRHMALKALEIGG